MAVTTSVDAPGRAEKTQASSEPDQAIRRVKHRELNAAFIAFVLASSTAHNEGAKIWQEWYSNIDDHEAVAKQLCRLISALAHRVSLHDKSTKDEVLDALLPDFFSPQPSLLGRRKDS